MLNPLPLAPDPGSPPGRTVADWINALAADLDPYADLCDLRARVLDSADKAIWIHLCPEAVWAAQLATLAGRLAEGSDRETLLKRYPLLGVPFAVKDNVYITGEPTSAACPSFVHEAQASATVVGRQNESRPVRHRPGRHTFARRPAVLRGGCKPRQRWLQCRLGSGGGAWPGGFFRWAPTRRARAAFPPASTAWSA